MDVKDVSGIGEVASAAKGILGMFFSDKTEEEKARISAAFALMQGQLDVNKVEAASPSTFVAGWRPYIGWVAGTALGMVYMPKALVLTGIWTYQAIRIISHWNGEAALPVLPAYPDLGVTDLIGLLGTLLGMGALRTIDKVTGNGNGH